MLALFGSFYPGLQMPKIRQDKKGRPRPGPPLNRAGTRRCESRRGWSERANLLGLGPLSALAGGELDSLVLLKTAESVNLNRGVVHEDVGAAVVRGDETVALVGVEPLHGALRHVPSPT